MSHEPLRMILVATDFSDAADRALDRALLLPAAPRSRLHLLHVEPAGRSAQLRSAATEALDVRFARALASSGHPGGGGERVVTSGIVEGEAYVEIIRCSRQLDAELVVVGRHSKHPSRELIALGSTARKVIRKGDVPVLVVSFPATHSYRRPLVASDLSDASRGVLDLALRVGGQSVDEITVLHALHVPFERFVTPTAAGAQRSRYRRDLEHRAKETLDGLVAMYEDVGVRMQPVLGHGDARGVIVNEAARREADLLVLGTHNRTGLSHLLIGSVASWVLEHAPCDVLVSHPVRYAFELAYAR